MDNFFGVLNSMKAMLTGSDDLNPAYQEILKLDKMLSEGEIPHELKRFKDGWQIIYPSKEEYVMDAIEHRGSYGRHSDLLEIMGLLTEDELDYDDVVGYLTAENVFERISKHWNEEGKKRCVIL